MDGLTHCTNLQSNKSYYYWCVNLAIDGVLYFTSFLLWMGFNYYEWSVGKTVELIHIVGIFV